MSGLKLVQQAILGRIEPRRIIFGVLIASVLTACGLGPDGPRWADIGSTTEEPVPTIEFVRSELDRGDIAIVDEQRVVVGASDSAVIIAPFGGTVDRRLVGIGDTVAQGDPLLILTADPSIRLLALELEAATLAADGERVDRARSAIEEAGLDPDRPLPGRPETVTSPDGGIIVELQVRNGAVVTPGQALVTVAKPGPDGRLVLRVPTADPAATVVIGFDDGTVATVDVDSYDRDTGTATIPLPTDAPVAIGDRLTAQVITDQRVGVVRVQADAVRQAEDGGFVVVDGNERDRRTRIDLELGLSDGRFVEVLAATDRQGRSIDPAELVGLEVVRP